jgi:hypothetical protein
MESDLESFGCRQEVGSIADSASTTFHPLLHLLMLRTGRGIVNKSKKNSKRALETVQQQSVFGTPRRWAREKSGQWTGMCKQDDADVAILLVLRYPRSAFNE